MTSKSRMSLALFALALLAGCPRLAYIEIYNNSPVSITADSSGSVVAIDSGESARFAFTGKNLTVKSDLGHWVYSRKIPHSGHDGEYFDGTLRVQINPDGKVYALKQGESPPIAEFTDQPEAYPLYGSSVDQ